MTSIIGTFAFPTEKEEIMEQFKNIAHREGKNRSSVLVELIEQYVKLHSEGNPAFTLDQFQDPDFKAYPATMSSKERWSKFIRENTNKEERMELDKIAKHIRSEIDAKNWLENRK